MAWNFLIEFIINTHMGHLFISFINTVVLLTGIKERDSHTLSLRGRKSVDLGSMSVVDVLKRLRVEIMEEV